MEINGTTPITLNLTVDTVNIVLGSLSTQPYERVAGLITSIQQEASAQVRAAHEAASNGVVEASAGPTNE